MLNRTYDNQTCSIARTLEIIGERWTLLIMRDALSGLRRFEQFQDSLGIARNVLTDRLARLVEAGLLERVPYSQRPPRYEYRPTAKGQELGIALLALMAWGDRHAAPPAGPPLITQRRGCGGDVAVHLACTRCAQPVDAQAQALRLGPARRRPTPRLTGRTPDAALPGPRQVPPGPDGRPHPPKRVKPGRPRAVPAAASPFWGTRIPRLTAAWGAWARWPEAIAIWVGLLAFPEHTAAHAASPCSLVHRHISTAT
jgi:DNA-binding HxlR family transcriptional regulator